MLFTFPFHYLHLYFLAHLLVYDFQLLHLYLCLFFVLCILLYFIKNTSYDSFKSYMLALFIFYSSYVFFIIMFSIFFFNVLYHNHEYPNLLFNPSIFCGLLYFWVKVSLIYCTFSSRDWFLYIFLFIIQNNYN